MVASSGPPWVDTATTLAFEVFTQSECIRLVNDVPELVAAAGRRHNMQLSS